MRTFAAVALALSFALPAHAQFALGPEPLSLSLTPTHPRPYETARVTVSSTLVSLSASEITITADGEVIGENVRSADVTFKGPGSRTVLRVVVVAPDGTYEKSLTVAPADVALILEPVSTAPPFYEGARQVVSEGSVRLIALPEFVRADGTRIPSAELSYQWRLGDKILEEYSGLGRNVLTATAPVRYRDANVTVTVSSRDGSLVAQASYLVSPQDPVVRVYRRDALAGIDFARALTGSYAMTGMEETLRAVPYFFSATPAFSWSLNGASSGSSQDLTLRSSGGESGIASVRVSVATAGGTLPASAETAFSVEFGRVGDGILDIFGI